MSKRVPRFVSQTDAVLGAPFFLVLAIPRSVRFSFDEGAAQWAFGIWPLTWTRQRRIEQIKSVYVRRVTKFSLGPPTYTLGVSLRESAIKPPIMAMIFPVCDLLSAPESGRPELWENAKKLAERIGVPVTASGWVNPDTAIY